MALADLHRAWWQSATAHAMDIAISTPNNGIDHCDTVSLHVRDWLYSFDDNAYSPMPNASKGATAAAIAEMLQLLVEAAATRQSAVWHTVLSSCRQSVCLVPDCAFCNASSCRPRVKLQVGIQLLFATMAPRLLHDAFFSWSEDNASAAFLELRAALRKLRPTACTSEPTAQLQLECDVNFVGCQVRRCRPVYVRSLDVFIARASQPQPSDSVRVVDVKLSPVVPFSTCDVVAINALLETLQRGSVPCHLEVGENKLGPVEIIDLSTGITPCVQQLDVVGCSDVSATTLSALWNHIATIGFRLTRFSFDSRESPPGTDHGHLPDLHSALMSPISLLHVTECELVFRSAEQFHHFWSDSSREEDWRLPEKLHLTLAYPGRTRVRRLQALIGPGNVCLDITIPREAGETRVETLATILAEAVDLRELRFVAYVRSCEDNIPAFPARALRTLVLRLDESRQTISICEPRQGHNKLLRCLLAAVGFSLRELAWSSKTEWCHAGVAKSIIDSCPHLENLNVGPVHLSFLRALAASYEDEGCRPTCIVLHIPALDVIEETFVTLSDSESAFTRHLHQVRLVSSTSITRELSQRAALMLEMNRRLVQFVLVDPTERGIDGIVSVPGLVLYPTHRHRAAILSALSPSRLPQEIIKLCLEFAGRAGFRQVVQSSGSPESWAE